MKAFITLAKGDFTIRMRTQDEGRCTFPQSWKEAITEYGKLSFPAPILHTGKHLLP